MGKGTEVVTDLAELQRRIQAMDGMLARAELLAAQLEAGEKLVAVVPAIRAHIEAARKLAAMA
jgi:hypothetical protein